MSLRLPDNIVRGIDQARSSDDTHVSRNAWILDAITAKLAEEVPALFGVPHGENNPSLTYYEFFAGGGMARMGLGP